MRRVASVLAILALASCKEKPKPPPYNPVEKGAALFAPAAEKLGLAVALDLKTGKPAWFRDYLKELGAKDEADLGRHISKELLSKFHKELSVTEAEEADLKAGKFADAENLKKVRAAASSFADTKETIPDGVRVTMLKVESGEWASGLQLEFAARLLKAHKH